MKRSFWWLIGIITFILAIFPSREDGLPVEIREYKPAPPKEIPVYVAAWAELKRRMAIYNRVDITLFLSTIGYVIILYAFKIRTLTWGMLAIAIIYLIARDMAGRYINKFQCPRCGEQFVKIDPHARSALWELDEKKRRGTRCRNCQLPLWTKTSET